MKRMILSLAVALFTGIIPSTDACMWDYDTLAMEREKFPETLELITGKFLRHSPAFYEWRVQDREARLVEEPENLALYDDLAVAYEKLGNHDKAIELMLKKEAISPGLYETYANLGTFYIHAGRLEEGVAMIDKAIEINPDAHFGREVYQGHLVEYVMSKQLEGEFSYPMNEVHFLGDNDEYEMIEPGGFSKYLYATDNPTEKYLRPIWGVDREKALKGIRGMMLFGNYDSPVLLEVLGDLLAGSEMEGSQLLAARAFLKASYEVKDEKAKELYRKLADRSLDTQFGAVLEELEVTFLAELAEAQSWYGQVEADEARWIGEGKNPEVEFTAKYYDTPAMSGEIGGSPNYPRGKRIRAYVSLIIVVGFLLLVVIFLYKLAKYVMRDAS